MIRYSRKATKLRRLPFLELVETRAAVSSLAVGALIIGDRSRSHPGKAKNKRFPSVTEGKSIILSPPASSKCLIYRVSRV